MSLLTLFSPSIFSPSSTKLLHRNNGIKNTKYVKCMANNVTDTSSDQAMAMVTPRRQANYHPSIWDNQFLQSLITSHYKEQNYERRASDLKKEVGEILNKADEPLIKLELIDTFQRLGISYHFEHEIKNTLEGIYKENDRIERWDKENNLCAVALEFRILRQHGYDVPQEGFSKFRNEDGTFKLSLCKDTEGILYLYEASFLSTQGESILEEARDFTTKILKEHLKNKVRNNECSSTLDLLVDHALELPLHWRMIRLEARWFIDVYQRKKDINTTILEFAKLDFNIVQDSHREDLIHMSRWWDNTCLGEKLRFARDRLMENFFWTIGEIFEPQYEYCRRMGTKINALITAIDDIYDVYGTLPELQLFTDAVEKWDISAMDELPEYMKICFFALYNSINEMSYDTLVKKGTYAQSYLTKPWADLCKSYLLEARWYHSGYMPTLGEYLENAWISIAGPTILVGAYFFTSNSFNTDSLETLKEYPDIVKWSSMIVRLGNDLGTSSSELKRGDNPKSIQCYMHETGASEEEAREHIKYLLGETWKKLNEEVRHHQQDSTSSFNDVFICIAMNLARMSQCIYQHGDGHGVEYMETKDRVLALVINPI